MALAESINFPNAQDFPVFVCEQPVSHEDALEVAFNANVAPEAIEGVLTDVENKIPDQTVGIYALAALAKGVAEQDIEAANELPGRSARLARIIELIEYNSGTAAEGKFESLLVERPPELAITLIDDNIRPGHEVPTADDKHAALSTLRYRIARSLGARQIDNRREMSIDADDMILPSEKALYDDASDSVVLAANELVTNVRRVYKNGGRMRLGITEEGKIALVVSGSDDGNRLPKSETDECYNDPAESGRGFDVLHGLGKVRRYPVNNEQSSWGTWFVPAIAPPKAEMSEEDLLAQFDVDEW